VVRILTYKAIEACKAAGHKLEWHRDHVMSCYVFQHGDNPEARLVITDLELSRLINDESGKPVVPAEPVVDAWLERVHKYEGVL
jgi:hypothetical protein